jgi:hypothetical protein
MKSRVEPRFAYLRSALSDGDLDEALGDNGERNDAF